MLVELYLEQEFSTWGVCPVLGQFDIEEWSLVAEIEFLRLKRRLFFK